MTASSVKFCPHCGSASVKFSSLAGGEASCSNGVCSWRGKVEDLLAVPFDHAFIGDEGMFLQLMNDLRQALSGPLGLPYLRLLTKWGFINVDRTTGADIKMFARYLSVIAKAILTAILEERAKVAAEIQVHEVGNDVQ